MTLFRTLDIVLVTIMIIAAGLTYKVKYDAQKRMGEVKTIERQIDAERNMISLLKADWALMIQPARLQQLTERYQDQLELQIIEPRQIVKASDIPEREPDQLQDIIKERSVKNLNEILANVTSVSTDQVKTGSIAR